MILTLETIKPAGQDVRRCLIPAGPAFVLFFVLILAGCNNNVHLTLTGDQDLTGFVTSVGSVLNYTQIQVGDNTANLYCRGFVSFGITSIPSDAVIVSADLGLYLEAIHGTPIDDLGPLLVDHVAYGDALNDTDFDADALTDAIATIGTGTVDLRSVASVAAALQDDVSAGRSYSQYRLRMTTDHDGDFVEDSYFYTREWSAEYVPRLVVVYQ